MTMCTVIDETKVMVCDVSRDRVSESVRGSVGAAAAIRTVDGEGTLFSCADPALVADFQEAVVTALGWRRWQPSE
jgi:predicted methyltransferase MtxX (methanogen marker protein 4)